MEIEELAKKLHEWYLKATKKLNPDSYNEKAQVPFEELTTEQKFIDYYIAEKVLQEFEEEPKELQA